MIVYIFHRLEPFFLRNGFRCCFDLLVCLRIHTVSIVQKYIFVYIQFVSFDLVFLHFYHPLIIIIFATYPLKIFVFLSLLLAFFLFKLCNLLFQSFCLQLYSKV